MITKGDEDYFMVGDDDLDKKLKTMSRLYLMTNCVRCLVGQKQSQASITDNYTGGSVGGSMELSSSKDAVMLKTIVLRLRVVGMVQNINIRLVEALKTLVQF